MRCVQWSSHLFRAHKLVWCSVGIRPVHRIAAMPNRIQMCVDQIVDARQQFERDVPDTDTVLPLRPDRIHLNVAADPMAVHWKGTIWWYPQKNDDFIRATLTCQHNERLWLPNSRSTVQRRIYANTLMFAIGVAKSAMASVQMMPSNRQQFVAPDTFFCHTLPSRSMWNLLTVLSFQKYSKMEQFQRKKINFHFWNFSSPSQTFFT